jgi:hypothetical protein
LIRYDAIAMTNLHKTFSDTDKQTEEVYLKLLRKTPLWRKAEMVGALTQACRDMSAAGIRLRHPNATEYEVRMRLASLWLSRDQMIHVYNWDPELKGY